MGLEINFGSHVVKWQRWQVGYLNEKSMRIMNVIDILPEYYWFYKQNGHSEINYEELFFDNQPIRSREGCALR